MTWTYLDEKTVKARKEHDCFFCGEKILKGETYDKREGVESGEGFAHMHMHQECKKATKNWDWNDYELFIQGDMDRPTVTT